MGVRCWALGTEAGIGLPGYEQPGQMEPSRGLAPGDYVYEKTVSYWGIGRMAAKTQALENMEVRLMKIRRGSTKRC